MNLDNKTKTVLALPAFNKLVEVRNRLRFLLSALAVCCQMFFVGGIAFYRDFFAMPISDNGTITWGIVFAALVIVLFVVLQVVYIVISERDLDPQQKAVKAEVESNA